MTIATTVGRAKLVWVLHVGRKARLTAAESRSVVLWLFLMGGQLGSPTWWRKVMRRVVLTCGAGRSGI